MPTLDGCLVRRDKLGRRIGRNWWREYVMSVYAPARQAWWLQLEASSNGWATEAAEFAAANPGPTLKQFLTGLAGTRP